MIKAKGDGKWKIPHIVLERETLCFSSYKNPKLIAKLWWVGPSKRKKRAFFVTFISFEGNFFNICVLSQYIVYWIHLYISFHISKNITSYTFLLVFKIVKRLKCILKKWIFTNFWWPSQNNLSLLSKESLYKISLISLIKIKLLKFLFNRLLKTKK